MSTDQIDTPSDAAEGPRRVERIRGTILFADLVGFTATAERQGVEEAYSIFTGALRLLDEAVRRYGGAVDKYLGDALLAVFGYPVAQAHPATAAIAAALEMRESIRQYNRDLRLALPIDIYVGINTGSVIAGNIRGRVIREFHVLGDPVNTAARIKAKAPLGAVWVGPETRAEADRMFNFRDLDPMRFKGKTEPVPVFEVVGLRDGAAFSSPQLKLPEIVGRVQEMRRLTERVALCANGKGGVVVLVGTEGVGKSRLLGELAAAKECEGTAYHQSSAPGGAGVRFDPLAAVAGESQQSDPAHRSVQVQDLLAERARERPLVWVFDDLQWADPSALELVVSLLPAALRHHVLFVLAFRPELEAEAPHLMEAFRALPDDSRERISLGSLNDRESAQLVASLASEVVDPETLRLVTERGQGNPGRLRTNLLHAEALLSETEREQTGEVRRVDTERRRSTVMFADITGFTAMSEKMDPGDAYPIVAGCLQLLEDITRKHGGTVDKYLGDCVLAMFGVQEAIEDAPRAALNAAIEMLAAVRSYSEELRLDRPLDVHIGINTGLGITGDISGPVVREFALMGDPVDVASRLCDEASAGEVYVGPETARLTEGDFSYRPRGEVRLKGSDEAFACAELLSRKQRTHRAQIGIGRKIFADLIGRDEELAQLRAAVTGLAKGRGGIISLMGEAGLGKSRLLAELMGSQEARSVTWLEGRSLSVGAQLSYHPFADLLRSWAGIGDDDPDEEIPGKVGAALRDLVPELFEELFPGVAMLMGLKLDKESVGSQGLEGSGADKVIRRSILEPLRAAARRQPVALVFDDLHWADLSSIELLDPLLRLADEERLLFINVFRPNFAATSDHVLGLVRERYPDRHREITLEPLEAAASKQLIHSLFRGAEVPLRLRETIEVRTGGNPFFVEEVVRSMLDAGAIEYRDGRLLATAKIRDVIVPGTVQEVIMARVDKLPQSKRQLLQLASVVGHGFHYSILEDVFGASERLRSELEDLVEMQFLIPWERLQGEEYAFHHPLIHEVTYDSLLHERRAELHRRVGEAAERCLPETLPGYHAMLAFHFGRGRDAERAETYLFRAGDEAAASAASNEALQFFQQASELYLELHGDGGDPRKKSLLEKNIGLALYNRGKLIEACRHFDQAIEELGQRVPRKVPRLALRLCWDLPALLANVYLPFRRNNRRSAEPQRRELVDIMFRRGLAQTTADPKRFVFDNIACMHELSKIDPKTHPDAAAIYSGAIGFFSYGGVSFGLGERFLKLASDLFESGAHRDMYCYFQVVSFVHHFLRGDWSAQHDVDPELLERSRRSGQLWEVTTYLGLDAERWIRRGEFDTARERMARIDEIWDTYEYDLAKTNHYALPLFLSIEQRHLGRALQQANSYYEENPEDLLHILALSEKAEVQVLAAELDDAEVTLDKAAELVKRVGLTPPFHLSAYRRSRLLFDVAKFEGAIGADQRKEVLAWRRRAARSARAATGIAKWVASRRPAVYRLAGRSAWLAGQRRRAAHWWTESLRAARALGMQPELGRTHQELAVRLGETDRWENELCGASVGDHRREAERIFENLGLAWDAERLAAASAP